MGKDYRNAHNQDKRFRGKKPERSNKKGSFGGKKHGQGRPDGDEFDDSFIDRIDERNYRK